MKISYFNCPGSCSVKCSDAWPWSCTSNSGACSTNSDSSTPTWSFNSADTISGFFIPAKNSLIWDSSFNCRFLNLEKINWNVNKI